MNTTAPYALDASTQAVRKKHADALFELARQAAEAGQLSLAFQWATETVRENPDHAEARRVLGYEQREWAVADGVWREDVRCAERCGIRSAAWIAKG